MNGGTALRAEGRSRLLGFSSINSALNSEHQIAILGTGISAPLMPYSSGFLAPGAGRCDAPAAC